MQSIPMSIVLTLVTISWSVGLFVGLFTARFVGKKDCELMRSSTKVESDKRFDALWERVDSIQDCLTGGKIMFEVRLMPKKGE
jgi:hypothetical protein